MKAKFLVKTTNDSGYFAYDNQKDAMEDASTFDEDGAEVEIYKLVKTGKIVVPSNFVEWE